MKKDTSPLLNGNFDEMETIHKNLKSPKAEKSLTKNDMMNLINDALDGSVEDPVSITKPSKVFNPVLTASEGVTDMGESPMRDGRTYKTKGSSSNILHKEDIKDGTSKNILKHYYDPNEPHSAHI